VEVSLDLISWVTNAVLEEVREWQGRPLDKSYAIVYLDALRVRGRIYGNEKRLRALRVNFEGKKEVRTKSLFNIFQIPPADVKMGPTT